MISPMTTLCLPFGWRRMKAGSTGASNLRAKTAGPIGVEAVRPRNSVKQPPGPASWSARKPRILPDFSARAAAKSSLVPREKISTWMVARRSSSTCVYWMFGCGFAMAVTGRPFSVNEAESHSHVPIWPVSTTTPLPSASAAFMRSRWSISMYCVKFCSLRCGI